MNPTRALALLVDVDDTLLENDRIQDDFRRHMESEFRTECRATSSAVHPKIPCTFEETP
jgi:hypothetical protein